MLCHQRCHPGRAKPSLSPTFYRPCVRRVLLALYVLILVGEVAWQQLIPLAPDLKESLGLDATRTGVLLAATPLAIVVVSLPAGLATDRLGAASLTVAATIVCGAACVAQGLLSESYVALIICRIGFGVGFAFIWTSGLTWLTDVSGIERRARTLSITIALAGISSFLGPGFAGLLAERTARACRSRSPGWPCSCLPSCWRDLRTARSGGLLSTRRCGVRSDAQRARQSPLPVS